jgi:hypothetical protein
MLNDNCTTDTVPPMFLFVEELTKCSKPMEEEFYDAYEKTFLYREKVKSHITSCIPSEQVLFCSEQREDDDEDETVMSMETLYSSIAASVESFSTLEYLCGADRLIHAAQREPFCGYVMKDREFRHLDDNNDVRSAVTFQDVLPKESNPDKCGFGLGAVRFQPNLESTNSVKVRVKLNPTPAKRTHWFPSEISPSDAIREREPSLNYIPYEVHNGFIPRSGDEKKEKLNNRDGAARYPTLYSPRHRIQKNFVFGFFDSPSEARGLLEITSLEKNDDSIMLSSSTPSTKARGRCVDTTDGHHQERTTLFKKIPPSASLSNLGEQISENAIENSIISALGSYDSVGQHINDEQKKVGPNKLPTEIVVQTSSNPNAVVVVVEKEDNSQYCLSRSTHEGRSQAYDDPDGNIPKASPKSFPYDTVDEGKCIEMKLLVELTLSADEEREKFKQDHSHGLNSPHPEECSQNEHSRISGDGPSLKASIDSISTGVAQAHSCSGTHCSLMSHSNVTPVNDHVLSSDPKSEKEEGSIRSFGTNHRSDPKKVNDSVIHIEDTSDETRSFKLADGSSPEEKSTSTFGLNSSTSLKPIQMHEERDDVEQSDGKLARKDERFEHFTVEESPRSKKITSFLTNETQPVSNDSPSLTQCSRSSSFDSLVLISYEDIDKVSSPTQKRGEVISEHFASRASTSSFHASATAEEGKTSGNDVNSFLIKYATTIGKDRNISSAIGIHKDVVQTHEKKVKEKMNPKKDSDKKSHWTTTDATVNESKDENHEGSKNDSTVSPSYIHSQMREDPVISSNEIGLKKERSGKKNYSGSTNQSSRTPHESHSKNREDIAGSSTEHSSEIVFSNAASEIQTKRGQPIASSEIIDPYLTRKNLYHGSRRNLPESSDYKIIGKNKKPSINVNLESGSKIEKNQVEKWSMPRSSYFSPIKQNDYVVDYNQTQRSDYRKDEKEEDFSRNSRRASYQIGPHSLEEPRLLSSDGRYEIPPIDPPNALHNGKMPSMASASDSLGLYSSANPMHGQMHHTRNHLEQSEGRVGRKDEISNYALSRSSMAPGVNGSMALSHINMYRTGSGRTDEKSVFHPREMQAVANSSQYLELHNGLQVNFPNINRYKDSDKFEPPSLSTQTDERKIEQIPVLAREAHGNQSGGVPRYLKNAIEAFRERILDDPQDFTSHKSRNRGENYWEGDKVTPSHSVRQTDPNLAGVEAESLRNKTSQQNWLRPKETTAALDDNERNIIIQRTLEYALSLSKSKEIEPPKGYNVSKVNRDHLSQQAENELHEFRPESYELEQYKFHPELIKESGVKRRTRVGTEQYRNQPELVQAYLIKKNRKQAVKKSNMVLI